MSGLYFFCYLLPCDVFGVLCRWTWWCFFLGFSSFFVLCIKIIAQKFVCYQELIYLCIAIGNCNVLDV